MAENDILEKIKTGFISILPSNIRETIKSKRLKRLEAGKDEKFRIQCKKEGRIEEYQQYLHDKKSNKEDIERFKKYIAEGINVPKWKYELDVAERTTEFIRPNDPEDVKERNFWRANFYKKFLEVVPKGMDLRFHGTPIYNAKAILESGGIFSSVDINDGYMASSDLSGLISTTSVESLDRTLQGWFADMGGYISGLPCGCIFALKPRTEKDQELKKHDSMESVNFREHPEQLYGIFTSKENIQNVRLWLQNAGLNPDLVSTFDGFLERLNKENNKELSDFEKNIVVKDETVLEGIEGVSRQAIANQEKNIQVEKGKIKNKEIFKEY